MRHKKGPPALGGLWVEIRRSHGVEQQVGEETIPLDQNAGGEGEPDRGNDGCCGEEFLHGFRCMRKFSKISEGKR